METETPFKEAGYVWTEFSVITGLTKIGKRNRIFWSDAHDRDATSAGKFGLLRLIPKESFAFAAA
jgi:hypothetical protein